MIYLDHAATTPICKAAKKAIIEHLDDFGNPSSAHETGHKAKMLIEDARERIAKCINAEPNEIYFTSGGSEADTLALNGRCSLASSIEHHAVSSDFKFKVTSNGVADMEAMNRCLLANKIYSPIKIGVVSCMAVNNELGTVQPIDKIAKIAHDYGALFHTDAVQAIAHLPIDVKSLGCDMLSASGHKFGAPKGVGFLYIKNGIAMERLINGGKQEQGVRGGTENTLGIIAMAAALEDTVTNMLERENHIGEMRDILLPCLLNIDGVHVNGDNTKRANRIYSHINVRIDGVQGQDVVAMADEYGICISAGSACNEGNAEPSHVLKAIGLSDEEALSSIRITLGHQNTIEEIEYVCDILPKIITRLRQINN